MKNNKINKEKVVMSITIGISCFALMLVMFMQFKVVRETDIAAIESMRETDLRTELSETKEKYKELNDRYTEVLNKIGEYRDKKESDEETEELLGEELYQLNVVLGKTDVEGEGIEIIIGDKNKTEYIDDVTEKNITYNDLLIIVNELFGAGAEAVSINDQRITAMTDIAKRGESYIIVNSERVVSPYVIKAIGNSTYLESAIFGKGGYADKLSEQGYEVTVNKSSKISIKKYKGTISTEHIN